MKYLAFDEDHNSFEIEADDNDHALRQAMLKTPGDVEVFRDDGRGLVRTAFLQRKM